MADVDLGSGRSADAPQTEKMVYMNIPTVIAFIFECREYPKAKRFTDAMITSLKTSFSNSDLRKAILRTFGQKTAKKLQKYNPDVYKMFTEIFGKEVWG